MLIHTFLIALLFIGTEKMGQGKGKGGSEEKQKVQNFIPKPQQAIEVAMVTKGEGLKKKPVKRRNEICKYWYGGVGLEQNLLDEVTMVAPGYAAERAGIRVGDELIREGGGEFLRGQPGTEVTVLIRRNGQMMGFTMTRERVCYDGT